MCVLPIGDYYPREHGAAITMDRFAEHDGNRPWIGTSANGPRLIPKSFDKKYWIDGV